MGYAHIDEGQRKIVKKCVDDADAWLTQQLIKQDRLKKYETPTLKCKDVDNKYREVYDQCTKIVNTPKPKPKKEEKPKEDKKEESEKNGDADKTATDDDKEKEKENVDADNDAQMKDDSAATTKSDDKTDGMQVE